MTTTTLNPTPVTPGVWSQLGTQAVPGVGFSYCYTGSDGVHYEVDHRYVVCRDNDGEVTVVVERESSNGHGPATLSHDIIEVTSFWEPKNTIEAAMSMARYTATADRDVIIDVMLTGDF